MLVSKIKEEDLTIEIVDKLLFQGLEDTGETVDCILVLGSLKAAKYRVPVAVNAYHAGRAKKIMLCGGVLRDFPDGTCREAEHMRKEALKSGVAVEDVILENSSQNTVENILFALVELQRTFWLNRIHKVLLVTTAYHMRRSLAIARYLFPRHIDILPCPANDSNTKRYNWMNSSEGIARAKGEAMNLVRCVRNGVIPDFEI
ncbi:MAG: YdcF family protein [Lachnospiraceae bacterium]|nr:YdcF family protein [Lachnospiraceae bacterium]